MRFKLPVLFVSFIFLFFSDSAIARNQIFGHWYLVDLTGLKYSVEEGEGAETSIGLLYANYVSVGLAITGGVNLLNNRYFVADSETERLGVFQPDDWNDREPLRKRDRRKRSIRYLEATVPIGVFSPVGPLAFGSLSYGRRYLGEKVLGTQFTVAVPFLFARRIDDFVEGATPHWEYGFYLKVPIVSFATGQFPGLQF